MISNLKQNFDEVKKIKRLIPVVQKYFEVDLLGATEILQHHTNLLDTDLEIEQQIQFYYKQKNRGE